MKLPGQKDIKKMLVWALPRLPPAPAGGRSIEHMYPDIVRDLVRQYRLETKVEWDSYGQGYASYVDAWFYRDQPEFRSPAATKAQKDFVGLDVLFCRLAPYYVMSEGTKFWHDRGGGGTMPGYTGVDEFPTRAVKDLSEKAAVFLNAQGLVRLSKVGVSEELPQEFHFDTNLVDDKHRLFDALFFWYD